MNIHIDRNGKHTVRLTKTEIAEFRRTERLVSDLERLGLTFPDPDTETLAGGLRDLLELSCCQPRTDKKGEAITEVEEEEKAK